MSDTRMERKLGNYSDTSRKSSSVLEQGTSTSRDKILSHRKRSVGSQRKPCTFPTFIEGEKVLLVTDHSALTWVKKYENANRRLVAWGLVFCRFPRNGHRASAGKSSLQRRPLVKIAKDSYLHIPSPRRLTGTSSDNGARGTAKNLASLHQGMRASSRSKDYHSPSS